MAADLVVINGQQYPADKIPDGVDASAAVPFDEWRVSARPNPPAVAASKPNRRRKTTSDE